MKKTLKILFILSIVIIIFSCGGSANLEKNIGKYLAYDKEDTSAENVKPYGLIIEQEGDSFYATIWFETIDGVKLTKKEKVGAPGGFIEKITAKGANLSCKIKSSVYDEIQIGPVMEEWLCRPYEEDKLKIFTTDLAKVDDMLDQEKHINSDIAAARTDLRNVRVEGEVKIAEINLSEGELTSDIIGVNTAFYFKNLLSVDSTKSLKAGDKIFFRGKISYIRLPYEGPVALNISDAIIEKR